MSQRLHDATKWIWCLLVLYSGPVWNPVRCVTVRSPPSNPAATIEAQAKFFQYRHFPSADDYDQGHRLGSDRHFTERHERSRPATGLFSAKVRWGDKKGGYGEHYWDLNHAGHTDNHGHDGYDDGEDGSYHDRDSSDAYDEPSQESPNYDTTYDPEKAAAHDDNGRAKRAPKRTKTEKIQEQEASDEEEKPQVRRKLSRQQKQQKEVEADDNEEEEDTNQEVTKKPVKQRRPQKQQQPEASHTEEHTPPKEKNHVVLVVNEKEKEEQKPAQYVQRLPEPKLFVPYEGGAGVRQHHQVEATAAASAPRLFLEPTTGHVVDRATGQAYVLQPIIRNPTYEYIGS